MEINRDRFSKIDLRNWSLPKAEALINNVEDAVKLAASEAIEAALDEYPVEASFPVVGRRHAKVSDPLTIRVTLPLGADDDTNPGWEFSLRSVIAVDLQDVGDADYSAGLRRVADSLTALAEEINEALAGVK